MRGGRVCFSWAPTKKCANLPSSIVHFLVTHTSLACSRVQTSSQPANLYIDARRPAFGSYQDVNGMSTSSKVNHPPSCHSLFPLSLPFHSLIAWEDLAAKGLEALVVSEEGLEGSWMAMMTESAHQPTLMRSTTRPTAWQCSQAKSDSMSATEARVSRRCTSVMLNRTHPPTRSASHFTPSHHAQLSPG